MNPGLLIVDGALWVAVPIAILAGLVSFLSPCVLPLVPGYLGFIAGAVAPRTLPSPTSPSLTPAGSPVAHHSSGSGIATGEQRAAEGAARGDEARGQVVPGVGRGRLLAGVLLFIAGFTLVFISMNVLGGTFGRFLLEFQGPITRVLGVIVIVLGLVFIGLFGIAQRTFRPALGGNLGLVGAPLLGIALGIGWAPCIGPTLTAILSLSWNLGDPGRGAILGLAYSVGLGLPFVLLALGFGWATRSVAFIRRHIRVVNIIGGALLVLLGILMVSGVWTAIMSQLQGVMQSVPLPL